MASSLGTAVVTGAAGGLGSAFARRLAKDGYKLLLIDSNEERLLNFSGQLRQEGSQVQHIVADFANAVEVQSVAVRLEAINDLCILVNNAGFGLVCKFQNVDLQRVIDMVHVHIIASIAFCRAVLPAMITRNNGSIVNVASAAAFMRFPRDAPYIASKSYLTAFTECLSLDLVGTAVRVQALCPGWIATDFTNGPDLLKARYKSPIPKSLYVSPEIVVASSLRALSNGSVTHIPGLKTRIAVMCISSHLGGWLLARMRSRGMGQKPMPGD